MLSDTDLMRLREATNRHLSLDWKIADILLDEIARLRAALDARPDISAEDAAGWCLEEIGGDDCSASTQIAWANVDRALHAHAQKTRPVCTCTRGLGDYCPTPDPDCKAHAQKAVKP